MSKRAVILSAVPVAAALGHYVQPGDFIVACDAGYRNAARLGLQPDLIVGDFDSAPQPETAQETIVLPHVKDDTDTQYAFTRPVVDHMMRNYDGVLKIDGEVGNKKTYDPRSWGKSAEAGMSARIVEACQQLGSVGTHQG